MTDRKKRAPRASGAGRALAPIDILSTYRFGGAIVNNVAVYHVDSSHPGSDGPWEDEADKTAWWDEATGLACIIRRSEVHGGLAGFVAVPRGHDLFGFGYKALAPLGVVVHGGLNYSEPCRDWEREEVSVCHVKESWRRIDDPVSGSRLEDAGHQELWWFGFSCDHAYDYVPRDWKHPVKREPHTQGFDIAQTYRDEAYVYHQVVQLAVQLKALGDGVDMPAIQFPPPPLGLEQKGGR